MKMFDNYTQKELFVDLSNMQRILMHLYIYSFNWYCCYFVFVYVAFNSMKLYFLFICLLWVLQSCFRIFFNRNHDFYAVYRSWLVSFGGREASFSKQQNMMQCFTDYKLKVVRYIEVWRIELTLRFQQITPVI